MYTKFCPSTSGKKHSVRPHWVNPLYYVYPKPQQQMPASCRRGTLVILPYVLASSMGTWPNPTQKVLQWMKGIFVCRPPQKEAKAVFFLVCHLSLEKPKQHRDAAVAGMGSKIPSFPNSKGELLPWLWNHRLRDIDKMRCQCTCKLDHSRDVLLPTTETTDGNYASGLTTES